MDEEMVRKVVREMLQSRINQECRLHLLLDGLRRLAPGNSYVAQMTLDQFYAIVDADDEVKVEEENGFPVARLWVDEPAGQ